MKKTGLLLLALLSLSPAAFAVQVGVSIAQMDDVFLSRLRGYGVDKSKTYPDMKAQSEDAQGAVDKQLSQVQNFINGKVDLFIFNPVVSSGTQ